MSPPPFQDPQLPPRSTIGSHLKRIASKTPHLFDESIVVAIQTLSGMEADFLRSVASVPEDDSELYDRIKGVRALDRAKAVEDLMHLYVMMRFRKADIPMLTSEYLFSFTGNLGNVLPAPDMSIFSPEAVEVLEARLPSILGMLTPHACQVSGSGPLFASRFHVAQMYANAALYGYFVRAVDRRFALEKSTGFIPPVMTPVETLHLLDDLYESAEGESANLDEAKQLEPSKIRGQTMTLREYIETLSPHSMMDLMQMVTLEASHVLQSHTNALFGDLETLQQELMAVLEESEDEGMLKRLRNAVRDREVAVVQLSGTDPRRLALEAAAFGAFLRDIEDEVRALQTQQLLTPNRPLGSKLSANPEESE